MEKYDKVKKIGRGTFGDVLLVQRKSDNHVRIPFFSILFILTLVICNEKSTM